MLWNAFLWKYRHLSALHISNTRECYDWVTLWWDTWEFKLGQKPAFREVINCELFTCFDKCSPQVQTWLKRRTSLATLYHDQNAGSPWLRPILPPPPALRPGLPFWIDKTWPKLTSLHFFVWKKRLHRVQITFECTTDSVWNIYMCRSRFGFSWLLSSFIPSRPHLPCPGCGSPDFVGTQNSEQRPLYPL